MPRLTNAQFLQQRNRLRARWVAHRTLTFDGLSREEHEVLSDYFAPSESFSDEDALRHRAEITAAAPSLPHRAGRAYRHAVSAMKEPLPNRARRRRATRVRNGQITVRAVRREHIDVHKLRRVLITLAKNDFEEQKAAEVDSGA
mgnify:CR=1 FL=1